MEQLINFIIRPPRAQYNPNHDLLDPEFLLKGKRYRRKDIEVVNSRGDVLQCSHYMPIIPPEGITLPCVIYCHGNSGCRTDASEAAVILLPSNITVFTLDFSGSGLSGGDHVTLGWNEKDDVRAAVNYLQADGNVSLIGLWGRSMGAVTSLMYGAEDPSIAGMVLDSPFSNLVDLMMELVDTYKVRLPKFTVKFAIQYMRRGIQKKAKFDITDLNTIKVAKSCFVPVLFGHANDDDFIQPHHSDRIFDAYVGDKNIIKFEGDHNSPRPQFYFDSISNFFKNVLQPPKDEIGSTYLDLSHDYFSKGRWSSIDELELSDALLRSPPGGVANATEDAIKQLRSKRSMSTMVVPADISSSDNQLDSQVESRESGSCLLASNMISFELSSESRLPHGYSQSHVPGLIDEDEYIEYPLDTVADFPTNIQEEERMLREATRLSLEDSEASSNGASDIAKPEPTPSNDQEDSFSNPSNSLKLPEKIATLAAEEENPATDKLLLLESQTEETHKTCSPCNTPACNNGLPHVDTINPTSHNDFDIVDRITVTLQVEKNPIRRWDLNFFRSR